MNKTVVIPTAGIGSRLGIYTQYYNKAMCTLGAKPVISYIIEKFKPTDEIIILLGYKGDLLKQVIKICYPDWNIKFVNVDNYNGEGSGPGYSILCARDLLQKPFIYWSNDTIIGEDIDTFDYTDNWLLVGNFDREHPEEYRHAHIDKNMKIDYVYEKNIYEDDGTYLPSIALCYVKDYEDFWGAYNKDPTSFIKIGDSCGLNNLKSLHAMKTETWIDTGKRHLFEEYKKKFDSEMKEKVLDKIDEFIWFIDNRVVKFHLDEHFIDDRVKRYGILSKLLENTRFKLPKLLGYDKNVYAYERVDGDLCSEIITSKLFLKLIDEYFFNVPIIDDTKTLEKIYINFYKDKTIGRIKKHCKEVNDHDENIVINDINCISASKLINNIDWKKISKYGICTKRCHGDFHLDNIIYDKKNDNFSLLDWRQNFADMTEGDLYYDFGKLLYSFLINHKAVTEKLYNINYIAENKVNVDIYRKWIYSECESVLLKWIELHYGKDAVTHAEFIRILTLFGSCGCHPAPYGTFLFYLGKYMLNVFYLNHKEYFLDKNI